MTKSYRYAWLSLALFATGPTACKAQPHAGADPGPAKGARFELGINPASAHYYSNEYTFMNLLTGSRWVDTGDNGRSCRTARSIARAWSSRCRPARAMPGS